MMQGDVTLRNARTNHTQQTGHRRVMIGCNFVHCEEYSKHGVLYHEEYLMVLGEHGYSGKQSVTIVLPSEF